MPAEDPEHWLGGEMPQVSAYGWQAVSEGSWFRQQEAPGPLATGQPGSSRARPRVPGLCCPWQEPLTDSLQGDTAGPSSPSLGQGSSCQAWGGLPGRRAGGPRGAPAPSTWACPANQQEDLPGHSVGTPSLSSSSTVRTLTSPQPGGTDVPGARPCSRRSQQGESCFLQQRQRKHRHVACSVVKRLHVREALVIRS